MLLDQVFCVLIFEELVCSLFGEGVPDGVRKIFQIDQKPENLM